jgi:EpsI family protein
MPELKVPNMRLLGVALTVFAAMTAYSLGQSRAEEIVPDRLDLNHFPLLVGAWQGTPDTLESIYIDALKFDDYMIANYKRGSDHLNFYIAWYGSQRSGQSAHSPRSCIPGGGWRIHSIDQMHLDDLYLGSRPLMTNRAVIQKGEARLLVSAAGQGGHQRISGQMVSVRGRPVAQPHRWRAGASDHPSGAWSEPAGGGCPGG